MDEYAASFLGAVVDDSTIPEEVEGDDAENETQPEGQSQGPGQADAVEPDSPKKTRGLRSGIFRAANIQDKLLEK
jgi:hypothetical protein